MKFRKMAKFQRVIGLLADELLVLLMFCTLFSIYLFIFFLKNVSLPCPRVPKNIKILDTSFGVSDTDFRVSVSDTRHASSVACLCFRGFFTLFNALIQSKYLIMCNKKLYKFNINNLCIETNQTTFHLTMCELINKLRINNKLKVISE